MYVIANVIYGVPINDALYGLALEVGDAGEDHPLWDALDDEDLWMGFEELYHGSSDRTVGFLGVSLGRLDDCQDFPLSKIASFQPTEEQKSKAEALFKALPPQVQELCDPMDVWVVWSTS